MLESIREIGTLAVSDRDTLATLWWDAGITLTILDRDPAKYRDTYGHFLTKEEVLEQIEASNFELDRVETFLPQHNIYIIRPKR